MDVMTASDVPGRRIEGYRNSSPRLIRLLGLGSEGGEAVQKVRGRPNVKVVTNMQPVGWNEVASDSPAARANMVVIVCAEGDEALFRPEQGRPDMLVTFVLLQQSEHTPLAPDDHRLARARRFSDLFVTTSDVDYVAELIDNLAS